MEIDEQTIENEFDMKAVMIQLLENSMLDAKQIKRAVIELSQYYNMDADDFITEYEKENIDELIKEALIEMGNPAEKVNSTSLSHINFTYGMLMKIINKTKRA